MTDTTASSVKDDYLAAITAVQDYLASITHPCPDCGGPDWTDDEKARACPVCDTYFMDGSEEALVDLQGFIRGLH